MFTKISLIIRPNNQISATALFESMLREISSNYCNKSKFVLLKDSISDNQIKYDKELINFTFFLLYNKINAYDCLSWLKNRSSLVLSIIIDKLNIGIINYFEEKDSLEQSIENLEVKIAGLDLIYQNMESLEIEMSDLDLLKSTRNRSIQRLKIINDNYFLYFDNIIQNFFDHIIDLYTFNKKYDIKLSSNLNEKIIKISVYL